MTQDAAVSKEIDRRRNYRPLARLDAKILSKEGHAIPADLRVETLDIAVGGVGCACNVRLQPQTQLRMTLTLVGGDLKEPAMIEAETRILRCSERSGAPGTRRYNVAMEFVRMDPRDRKRLQSYVNCL
ncbi:MAG TPA: PilZ domain-containing protein [Candidatus Polarisedimenticolia bacterium]|nr:PilZ domain-containing protein [Candidatus Polarisedimenticolia bacterium]